MHSPAPDFAGIAPHYDELRPVDDNWWKLFGVVVERGDLRGRRVLDIGCGTGRLASALADRASAKVWGVDATPEMLALARRNAPGVAFREARAEALPFKAGWFERVVMWLVLHLTDRQAALAEARRVVADDDGRIAVVSFHESHFDGYWLNRFLPSLERIDRARFPTAVQLEGELDAAGFGDVELVRVDQEVMHTRADALARLRGRHISTLRMIDADEYERGVAAAERDLPDVVHNRLHWLIAFGVAA